MRHGLPASTRDICSSAVSRIIHDDVCFSTRKLVSGQDSREFALVSPCRLAAARSQRPGTVVRTSRAAWDRGLADLRPSKDGNRITCKTDVAASGHAWVNLQSINQTQLD